MRVKIKVKGIVQGVGFRPFVYRIAKKNNLKGYVKNLGNYVEIFVEGKRENKESFIYDLKNKKPPLSRIDRLDIEEIKDNIPNFDDFYIIKSVNAQEEEEGTIPADVAICDDCLREMFDKNDRRYRYPFTACTNCGPRFTIVEKIALIPLAVAIPATPPSIEVNLFSNTALVGFISLVYILPSSFSVKRFDACSLLLNS